MNEEDSSMSTPITFAERVAEVRTRFGFTEADLQRDPLRASLVENVARGEQRVAETNELEDAVGEVARELGFTAGKLTYVERNQVFNVLARRRHPVYVAERYRTGRST
jgi:hypothetical protein